MAAPEIGLLSFLYLCLKMAASISFVRRLKLAGKALIEGQNDRPGSREIPPITADEVAEARAFFPSEKYFVFGHSRSGTTLLTRLLRLHPKVHCNYQGHFFTRPPLLESLVNDPEVGSWLTRRSNRWNRGKDLSPVVLRAAVDFILERDARLSGKSGADCAIGDKSPNSLLNGEAVKLLVKVYPDARLIFIVRDGRDAILSHRFQAYIDTPHHLSVEDNRIRESFVQNPDPFLSGKRSLFGEKSLRQEIERWVNNVGETDRIARELLGSHYAHLRFEDLLSHPWEEMCRLWTFLGVDPEVEGLREKLEMEIAQNPDADWQMQKANDIAGTLQKGKRGAWREILTLQDRELFDNVAGQMLKTWGYDNNSS
jgi:Sulfotransferase family